MHKRLNAIKSDTKIGLADAPVAAAIIFHGKTPKITGNPIIQSINPPSGYESSSDTATMVLRRGESAQTIYNQYKGQIKDGAGVSGVLAPDTSANSSECLGGDDDGAVSSNIVATALNYALKTPATNTMNQKSDATLAYQIGKERYNPSGAWADCGVFVATVMIASGVDVNYPKAGVVNQISYVRNHPELYKIIENPQPSDLQAGDILIAYGSGAHHTSIYTGESPYSSVDSSQDTRVPSVRNSSSVAWMLSSGAIIARVIK